jgi:hypothetical protein
MSLEAPELVSKQEREKIYARMDFSNVLGTKTISSIDSILHSKRGGGVSDLIIDSEVISNDGKSVEFFVGGGTKFYTYRVEILVYDSAGQHLEGDGLLEVLD